jgi:hypothetical protein
MADGSPASPVEERGGRPKRARKANSNFAEYVQQVDDVVAPPHPKRSRVAPRASVPSAMGGAGAEGAAGGGGGGSGDRVQLGPRTGDANELIQCGSMGDDGDAIFFALNEGYYAEIARRGEMVVQSGRATWGGPRGLSLAAAKRDNSIMEAAIEEAAHYRGILRRKNAYVWQTRLMIERTSLNAGHFEHPLLAAVAYDFAQTFLRPALRNANGTSVALNFANSASDTRVVPVTRAQGLTDILLEKPGVAMEDGHFWAKDDSYYAGAFPLIPAPALSNNISFLLCPAPIID